MKFIQGSLTGIISVGMFWGWAQPPRLLQSPKFICNQGVTERDGEDPIQYEVIIILRLMINHKNIHETH